MEIVKKFILFLLFGISLLANDIIIRESHCSFDQTVANIKDIIRSKGLTLFAVINHSGNAKAVDMNLNDSKMIVFGNAKLGTALMQQDMSVGLDLPLRILVYRDGDGSVKMAYRDGSWIANHHILNAKQKIEKINKGLDKITMKAGQCKKD